ncbi:hypothetical protein QZH56_14505 [Streptomyces olivoreticuli]|uniref:hypothetical protein n=1 Tax=Streptomyces olivoreticuli TaxID=68246 RepID=UPI00265ACA38|nr:hypothetical protein [Streptomyces olivoreticuli]WKK26694.1 hypothetical protein QZH56_14505 [Streptomyces olivoreticuli]
MLIPPMMPPIPLPHSSGPPATPRVWKPACETCAILATNTCQAELREDRVAVEHLRQELAAHCRDAHSARIVDAGNGHG